MNREIKFRAWDSGTNTMRGWDWVRGNNFFDDELPIMQYTGLKDKNGVEIYEGDLISFRNDVGQVFWSNHSASFGCHEEWGWDLDRAARGEVIGNLYENPELLEKEIV